MKSSAISWGCISAAGKALVINAFPWAKVLKIKKAAKLAGGINTLTKTVVKAYKVKRGFGYSRSYSIKWAVKRATRSMPVETQKAALELFSIGDVVDNCF